MEPNLIQEEPQMEDLTPEEAKASLGIVTRLSSDMLKQEQQAQMMEQGMGEEPMEGEEIEEEPEEEVPDERDEKIEKLEKELKEVKASIKDEISTLKETLQKALEDDEDED
jgi:hypothetical protein